MAGRQLLVAYGRSADVAQLRPRRRARGAEGAGPARTRADAVVLLLAGLHARARSPRRGEDGALRRLPRRAHRVRHDEHPHPHRRAHVRRELGPVLARRPRPVRRRVDGLPPGLVRRADDAQVRRAPGGRGLADQQRDADLRPPVRPAARPHRAGVRVGPADGVGRTRRRWAPAGLARRRGVGRRGHRRGQRVLRTGDRRARRLRRPARLPDGQRCRPPAPQRGLHL